MEISLRKMAFAWRTWSSDLEAPPPRTLERRHLESWHLGLGVTLPSLWEVQRQALALLQGQGQPSQPLTLAAALTIAPESVGQVLAVAGPQKTTEGLLLSSQLRVAEDSNYPRRYRWLGYAEINPYGIVPPLDLTAWGLLRLGLACLSEAHYQEVVAWAGHTRKQVNLEQQVMLAFLLPDAGWADDLVEPTRQAATQQWGSTVLPPFATALIPSLRDREAVEKLWINPTPNLAASLVANLGSQAYALILPLLQGSQAQEWAKPLWFIPDPVLANHFKTLLDIKSLRPRISAYFSRFPQLGVAALASQVVHGGKGKESARALLNQILRSKPQLPPLEAREAALCAQLLERSEEPSLQAKVAQLPPLLQNPPWCSARPTRRPQVACARTLEYPEKIHWGGPVPQCYYHEVPPPAALDDEKIYQRLLTESRTTNLCFYRLDRLSDARALQLWNELPARKWEESWPGLSPVLARFGLEALPAMLRFGEESNPHLVLPELARVESPRAAGLMAQALAGQKHRRLARQWLKKFPQAALLGLIPLAVGPAGKRRDEAEEALHWMASWNYGDEIRRIGEELGVSSALQEVLDFDPLQRVPSRLPKLPSYLRAEELPRPRLRSGEALPLETSQHVLTMLSFTPLEPAYAGLEILKQACSADSLEDFAWELYLVWHSAGGPSKDKWIFQALAHLGGDEVARQLAPLLRAWPQEGLFARAEQGLDILAGIGTDLALLHLYQMSQQLKSKALQEKACRKVEEIAARRGLSAQQLGDRLVPCVDLKFEGYELCLDEQLRPRLSCQGKSLKDMPKSAPESIQQRWKALKKDLKTMGQAQILRLERAMSGRRRWSPEEWERFVVGHPVLVHLVRRLLWGHYQQGALTDLFRVAEDSSLANLHDDPVALPRDGYLGLPHPLELSPELLSAWGQVFADYELLQPFAQLGRACYPLTAEEQTGNQILRQQGRTVHPGKLTALEGLGWLRGETWDGGVCCQMLRPMGEGLMARLDFHDGIFLGALQQSGDQRLGPVELQDFSGETVSLERADSVDLSELLKELETLR